MMLTLVAISSASGDMILYKCPDTKPLTWAKENCYKPNADPGCPGILEYVIKRVMEEEWGFIKDDVSEKNISEMNLSEMIFAVTVLLREFTTEEIINRLKEIKEGALFNDIPYNKRVNTSFLIGKEDKAKSTPMPQVQAKKPNDKAVSATFRVII